MEQLLDASDGDYYRTGARVDRHDLPTPAMLTVFATAAAHGHVGPGPQRRPRARMLVQGAHRGAALLHGGRRRRHYDKMFHTPGVDVEHGRPLRRHGQVDRPEGRRGPADRLPRPRRARPRPPRTPTRIHDEIHQVAYTRVLPLPAGAPQPDQLARRAVRLRLPGQRRPDAAARGLPQAHARASSQGFKTPQIARRRHQRRAELPLHLPVQHRPAATRATSTARSTRT